MEQPAVDLVAVTDRSAIDRQFRPVFAAAVVCAALATIVLAVVIGLLIDSLVRGWTTLFIAPTVLLGFAIVACSVVVCVATRRRWLAARELRERVQVDAHGIVAWLPTGSVVRAPWQAVLSARRAGDGRWARLTLQIDTRFVEGRLSDADRRRMAARGIVIDAAGMHPELAVVAHAMAVRTQGRLVA